MNAISKFLKDVFCHRPTSQEAQSSRRRKSRRLNCESLERRELCAILAGQTIVNKVTTADHYAPQTAAAPDGRYVVVWVSQASGNLDIRGQRFAANGSKVGTEISIASTTRNESSPDVAMDGNGNFIVAWQISTTSANEEIQVRRFNSNGVPVGSVFTAIGGTATRETSPSIAASANGDFVIAASRILSTGGTGSVVARRFAANGAPQSNTFIVTGNGSEPDVARAPDGRFAIAYMERGDAFVKRFAATGTLATTSKVGVFAEQPSVAMDDNANLVATWSTSIYVSNGSDRNIYAKRISNTGVVSNEIPLVTTPGYHSYPSIAMMHSGAAFAITYLTIPFPFGPSVVSTKEFSISGTLKSSSTLMSTYNAGPFPLVFGAGRTYQIFIAAFNTPTLTTDIFRLRGSLS